MRTLLPYFIFIISVLNMNAENLYFSKYTGFGNFSDGTDICIQDENLVSYNKYFGNKFYLHRYPDDLKSYVFEISLANPSNIEGVKINYKDSDGKDKTTLHANWGIVWNYSDRLNYHFLRLSCNNQNLDDLYDQRSVEYKIGYQINGDEIIIKSGVILDNINLYDGYSKFKIVSSHNGNIEVFCGLDKYILLHQYSSETKDSVSFGYFSGSGITLKMNKAVFCYTQNNKPEITKYNKERLKNIFNNTTNNLEGYWTYLDRNIQNNNVKLGGKYRLAIVKDEESYIILYINGQQRENERWLPYSVKGRLYPTDFVDTYNLIWYDTLNTELSDDNYVQLVDNKILEVHFPILRSSIRFVKE